MRGCASTSQYVFVAWCLVKHGDNFTFFVTSHVSWIEPADVVSFGVGFHDREFLIGRVTVEDDPGTMSLCGQGTPGVNSFCCFISDSKPQEVLWMWWQR